MSEDKKTLLEKALEAKKASARLLAAAVERVEATHREAVAQHADVVADCRELAGALNGLTDLETRIDILLAKPSPELGEITDGSIKALVSKFIGDKRHSMEVWLPINENYRIGDVVRAGIAHDWTIDCLYHDPAPEEGDERAAYLVK